jgi:maleate isomerase
MVDSLGFRKKFGVIAPSTNTSVQPEFDAMRPFGVINHFEGIYTPDIPLVDAESVNAFLDHVRKDLMPAVDRAMTCAPAFLIMGMSSETFWDGLEGANKLRDRVEQHSGVKVGMGSDACRAALKTLGNIRKIAVVTPYQPNVDEQVVRFFKECGYDVVRIKGFRVTSAVKISHISEKQLRDAIISLDGDDVEAIVQVGTNVAMSRLAGIAEFWLDKPVVAINTATYWDALRRNGVADRMQGFGSLLAQH